MLTQKHLDVVALTHPNKVDIIRDGGYNVARWEPWTQQNEENQRRKD